MEMQIRIESVADAYPRDLTDGFSLRPGASGTDALLVGTVADVAEMRRALLLIYTLGFQLLTVSPV
jgi:hypothetical protein